MTRIGKIFTDNHICAYPCAIVSADEHRRDIYIYFNIFSGRADMFPKQPTGIKTRAKVYLDRMNGKD
jgi:hypothetical protein